jgi:hypothetical protein
MTPAEFLLALLIHEAPAIGRSPKLTDDWRAEVEQAVELDVRVGAIGALVSPEVDTAIIDSMRWYEARLRSKPKDGDCEFVAPTGTGRLWGKVCTAFGPLQVRATALKATRGTPEGDLVGVPPAMAPEALRDPELGVRAGYAGLLRWKRLCGGTPARWITAWGWGRCPKARVVDREAVRRCELTVILLRSRGQAADWKCGHENRKIRDPYDQRFLKRARVIAGGQDRE